MKKLTASSIIASCLVTSLTAFAQPTPAASAGKADNQPQPVVMLVPVEISNKALEAGCWAQFYDERNFNGDILTVVGPAQIDSTDKAGGRQFKRSIDSLVLGPKATLKVFEHQMFRDRSVNFAANAREAGLVTKLGFGGRIESLQLECTQ